METEDSADDVFTSSNVQGGNTMNPNGDASNDSRNVPTTSSGTGHRAGFQQEDEEVIAGGSSYLPSHPEPLLPPEAPMVPPIPISISDENYHRGNWGTKLEFLSAMICQLTPFFMFNFAYQCYRSGGLIFVVPFIVMLFVLGLPVILMQISIGQFSSTGFLTMWRFSPVLKGVSASILLFTVGNMVLLNILFTETLSFVYATLSSPQNLPWSSCANVWNTDKCQDTRGISSNSTTRYDVYHNFSHLPTTPAEEYRRYVAEGNSLQIEIIISALVASCLLLQATLMGIKIVGKLSLCCLVASFLLTVVLLVRSATLPGSYVGLQFLFYPVRDYLFKFEVWKNAFFFVAYLLTFNVGTNITLASHNRFHNNCFLDTAILVMVSIFAPLMLAIATFSFFGFFAYHENLEMNEVVTLGPRMFFEALPQIFLKMPVSHLWTQMWFGLLALNLFTSEIGIIIAITSSILDLFGWVHSWRLIVPITLIICVFLFLVTGFGIFFLGIEVFLSSIDEGLQYLPFIVVAILAFSLVWIYGGNQNFQLLRFGRDIEIMVGFFPAFFDVMFTSLWGLIVPLLLAVAILYRIIVSYEFLTMRVWIVFGLSLLVLGVGFILGALHEAYQHIHINTYFTDYFYRASLPHPRWGPALDAHRKYAGYLPSDFTPQPYRLTHGDHHPEAGLQPTQPVEAGSTAKDTADPGATLPASTPLLGLTLCSTETTL
ncbi:Sodium- and chloride-dependent glycine transporter 1 [Holothuria leucospilota]|uniref:Sodium- and chloride-dependent glycine transporter 1 n=1 Tax=Holothuria leucospilota TaxID=206669 RepID=A0A9Q1GWD2_HOLLE|nr:Sodium- and chloride-dependent glycine transporter 1 [Holothuria leucospilota]